MPSSSEIAPEHGISPNQHSPEVITDTATVPEEIPTPRRTRLSRACTVRSQKRLQEQQLSEERKFKQPKDDDEDEQQCGGKIVTSLVNPPEDSQVPRWSLRSMWELASILNFLHVFRPILNIKVEFSSEELETALLNPNDTLSDVHIPLLKAIPPIARIALTRDTWVTVLCRKLRYWWHWVAEGDLPIVASHGVEIEVYKSLDPGIRVVILKALCDIRVESNVMYHWETVATNFDEFLDVLEKLFSSNSRTEASLGKKLKNDMLPEIEREHKERKLLKKQHRQALLLDNFLDVDGFGAGRSRRDRKPVTYTFDDYDRSINDAMKITKKKPSDRLKNSENGEWTSSIHPSEPVNDTTSVRSSDCADYDDIDEQRVESVDRSNRRRQRPQRYSTMDYVENVSDNEVGFESDDNIVGEAVYDDDYRGKRKQKKELSSASEGDEEYQWDEDDANEEEEEEEEEDSLNAGE